MFPDDAKNRLAADIATFIADAPPETENAFNSLARRLFTYQFAHCPPYQAFCRGRGVTPEAVTQFTEIPPVPAAAFQRFALSAVPVEDCVPERNGRTFFSSGTTGPAISRHFLDAAALDLYRQSLRAGFRQFVTDAPLPILALMPPPADAPHSSLSFMLEELGAFFFWENDWQTRLWEWIGEPSRAKTPCVVFGTAFAWMHYLDWLGGPTPLPAGSQVIETGGFKGRSREIARADFYRLLQAKLGVPDTHCQSEYGMSEMASQFYGRGVAGPKQKPHWVKTRVLDPVTQRENAPETAGLLVHYDLANLNSAFAIQTEDWGYQTADGNDFVLLGRAPGAILRGCSLTAEEWG